MIIGEFDGMAAGDARRVLLDVCSAPRWVAAVLSGRPYRSLPALQDAAAAALAPVDLDPALTGHPRIGDRTASGTSSREQAAVTTAGDDVLAALRAGNAAYEQRFGHVYLVCAAGRSATDLLATLHARLANDPATERGVALRELAAINGLRIAGMITA